MKKRRTKANNHSLSRMRPQKGAIMMLSILTMASVAGIMLVTMPKNPPNTHDESKMEKETICTTYAEPASSTKIESTQTTTIKTTTTTAVTSTQHSTTTLSTSISTQTTSTHSSATSVVSTRVTPQADIPLEVTTTTTMTSTMDSTEDIETSAAIDEITELSVTEAEYIMLCNLVGHEYGSDWVPIYEKGKVAAVAMNRLHNGYWGSTLYDVLTYPGQFPGFSSYGTGGYCTQQVTPSVREAVDYYLAHPDEYDIWLYFDGGHYAADGSGPWNYFYY